MNLFAFMSPDEALLRILAGPMILSGIALLIAIPIQLWRRNIALNDPEKYRRLRAWEEEEAARNKKAMAEAAGVAMKIGGAIAKIALKKK